MNYKEICFVSVAFGEAYLAQQTRLKKSILDLLPDANILFYYDCMPPGARDMGKSLYGFKVHAIAEAKKRYSKVIWLDPAMIMMDKDLSDYDDVFFAAVKDDHKLSPFISDQALSFYGITRHQIEDYHLVGGSLYYFDFEFKVVNDIFNTWLNSEVNNLFDGEGQTHTGATRGHRSDEALMALSMWKFGIQPTGAGDIRYCIENNPAWIKKHFK
jgi:hypothetical protein